MTDNFKRAYLADITKPPIFLFEGNLVFSFRNTSNRMRRTTELISAAFYLGPDDKNVASSKATNNVR